MDTNMEDVGRAPEPARLSPATEPASIPTLDGWIESLMTCKQLAEVDVQRLCDKVCLRDIARLSQSYANGVRSGKGGFAGRIQCAASGKTLKYGGTFSATRI